MPRSTGNWRMQVLDEPFVIQLLRSTQPPEALWVARGCRGADSFEIECTTLLAVESDDSASAETAASEVGQVPLMLVDLVLQRVVLIL
jgi:hypothetical protein